MEDLDKNVNAKKDKIPVDLQETVVSGNPSLVQIPVFVHVRVVEACPVLTGSSWLPLKMIVMLSKPCELYFGLIRNIQMLLCR